MSETPQMRRDPVLAEILSSEGMLGKLARGLGVTEQAVCKWRRVPPGRVIDVERLTGVSRYRQRPDVFGSAPTTSGCEFQKSA